MGSGLRGRVVVVTGAGHGLGREFARSLARSGARVVVNDLAPAGGGESPADAVVEAIRIDGGEALAAPGDVTSEDGVRSIVDRAVTGFGGIHGLVNNAGIVNGGPFVDQDVDRFRAMLDVHIVGSFLMARQAWPHLKQTGGSLVNVVSNVGYFGLENMASYAAAKGGVSGLSRVLALEGEGEVRVNCLAPMAATNPGRTAAAEQMFAGMGKRAGAEWVAPLLLQLLDPSCTSHGGVYSAVGGRYARIEPVVGGGWVAPGQYPPGFDDLRANWPLIADPRPHHRLRSMNDEVAMVKRGLGVAEDTTGS